MKFMVFDVDTLTTESIINGALRDALPELYRLRSFREESSWHNDTPFSQSIRLFTLIQSLPNTKFPVKDAHNELRALLQTRLDRHSWRTILAFAALIHDIGKADTFELLPDGSTRCPGHEEIGAQQTPAICARFGFSRRETELITTLVQVHGEPYALHKDIADQPAQQQAEKIARFERKHTSYLRPLLLLAWGDLTTSHLRSRNPNKYRGVNQFYQQWLNRTWPKQLNDELRVRNDEFSSFRLQPSSFE